MPAVRSALALVVTALTGAGLLSAQTPPGRNPLAGNPDAIRNGQGLYRARCANCHGMDATGVRGPDLTALWAGGRTDDGLFHTVRTGIPGTEMPAAGIRTQDDDVWRILAYLRTLNVAPAAPPAGDAANGERIFRAQCAGCHRVNGRGGRLGPDLSRIGAARARGALVRQIRGANEDVRPGYEPVTLTLSDGQSVRGVKKNEDLFSVQIMDTGERIQGYLKNSLRGLNDEARSAMPVYGPDRLSESDLNDLLQYLATLRGK
jgi:putative heme-binding domain-containing protein